ncbi:MAG: 3'-5' exonuclease [Opitutaceae bacterium]|nr:3'-5' exonuclease [Opitutaceae bacterium]
MGTNWTERSIHFLDFEGSVASGIVEYGVVTLQGGEVKATATRLCRPTGKVRTEDVAVHGLDATVLAGAASLTDDFERFAAWRESGPLAAHFAGAENSLLKSVWPYPRSSPDFARPGKEIAEWGPWIDTGALYRQFYPRLASYKLADLVAACGLQPELNELAATHCPESRRHYHAAPYDALAGAVLLRALGREPQLAELSIMQLLALSTLDGGKRDALQQEELF